MRLEENGLDDSELSSSLRRHKSVVDDLNLGLNGRCGRQLKVDVEWSKLYFQAQIVGQIVAVAFFRCSAANGLQSVEISQFDAPLINQEIF